MKFLIILTALMTVTMSFAQTETRRPSWSQGLPERPTSQQPDRPGFNTESTTDSTPETPAIKTERPITPSLEIDLATEPEIDFNIQPERPIVPQTEPVRRAGQGSFRTRQSNTAQVNPLHEQYPWTVVKITPIKISDRYATKDTLKVRIFINPNGEVIKVTAASPDVPALMLKKAQKSIEQWRFAPPKDLGITENLAKTFTIEIKAG
ncbi:MAG: hypothetical protein DWP95_00515 [Proteobacteria bacterium]|nr:MAG: hypothetical protein DWP95_00515 [Pseudomonadota bacterium]